MIRGIDDTYIIIEEIGHGGTSQVYKAYHKRLKKEVVIKKIHSHVSSKIDTRAEADILKNLKHSYLPKVLDFIVADGNYYTVTDYIDGYSFAEIIENGKEFTQKELIRWSIELCEALEYLHVQTPPIIHGDIKPGNVMLTSDGHICLIDFNISNVFKNEGMIAVGYSNGFSPPEQYSKKAMSRILNEKEYRSYVRYTEQWSSIVTKGREGRTEQDASVGKSMESLISHLDETELLCETNNQKSDKTKEVVYLNERSDIYSLGATIYFMVTGHKPRVAMLFEQDIDDYEGISDGLKYIITKAMAANPSERFSSVSVMKRTLLNIHRLDNRYRRFVWKQYLAVGVILVGFLVSGLVIHGGRIQIQSEKIERYDSLISQMQNNTDEEQTDVLFNEAIKLVENRPDAYYQKAVFYYRQHDYVACHTFIEEEISSKMDIFSDDMKSEIHFLNGECYFYQEDYENAIKLYQEAIGLKNQLLYYPSYAIALIKIDRIEDAEEILSFLENEKYEKASIYMIEGELAYKQGDLSRSKDAFYECMESTDDSYMYFRSVYSYGDVCRETEDVAVIKKGIDVLKDAVNKVLMDYKNLIQEKTAELYITLATVKNDSDYYEEAIDLYVTLMEESSESLTRYLNLSILYSRIGENQQAQTVLKKALDLYGEDFQIYKRLALTEAAIQSKKDVKQRQYEDFLVYYTSAQSIYEEKMVNNQTDLEMKQLEQIKEDLASGGWF